MGGSMSVLAVPAIIVAVALALGFVACFLLQRSLNRDKARRDQQARQQQVVPSGGGGAGTSVLQPGASDEKLFSAFSTGVTSEKDYELANSLAEGRRLEANMAHVEQASAHMGGVLERLGSSRQLIVVKDDHLDIERSKSFV